MRLVETYYTIEELVTLLKLSDSYIRRQVRLGEFGPRERILKAGTALRVPVSGVNLFLENHSLARRPGVVARTPGELRRKVAAVQTSGSEDAS